LLAQMGEGNPLLAMIAPFLEMGLQSLTDEQQTTSYLTLLNKICSTVLIKESSDEEFMDALAGIAHEAMSNAIQH